ncbi:hypothetical protein [Pseudoalteromonas byunsanensis]|uniref:Ribosomal subunit interface protein n=1 Tax=Pseudoalteromonas byunsanensis TaxID=327939 RepID=A0A1S1N1X9_9GAMM|nr:hypothetical protein [Pseudoalteromonas byunsanensis]OHU93668.1 hypothetical protein BIW53_20245 [Pseudoalteromonas byunsanensis]
MKLKLSIKDKTVTAAMKVQLSKLVMKQLQKYALNIRAVELHIDDVVSRQNGLIKQCRLNLQLPGLPSIVLKAKGNNMLQAIKRALHNGQKILAQKYAIAH